MPGLSTLVQATLPRQRLDNRGEVPSIVQYLHCIESEKKLYHSRSTGTDLLGGKGKKRKASYKQRRLSAAIQHALYRRRWLQQQSQYMVQHRLLQTSCGTLDGFTIAFSVFSNDDCYRTSHASYVHRCCMSEQFCHTTVERIFVNVSAIVDD